MIDIPVRAIDALRDGRRLKRYHFDVLNDDGSTDFTITNENLVSETVKFDERMCSGSDLKFGLCEGSSLEFQYFGLANINKRRLNTSVDVQYKDASGDIVWHTIPMGYFDVAQCPMQFSTGIRKAVAYNKLKSDYLDAKANDLVKEAVDEGESGVTGAATIDTILMKLLNNYTIEPKFNKASYTVPSNWTVGSGAAPYYKTENDDVIYAPYGSLRIDISHLNPNGAYRIFVDRGKIRDELWTAMGGLAHTPVRNVNYPSDSYYPLYEAQYADGSTSDMHLVSPAYTYFLMTSGRVETRMFMAGGDDKAYTDYVIKKYTTNTLEIDFPLTFILNDTGVVPSPKQAWDDLPAATRASIQQKWTNLFSDPTVFRIEERDSNAMGPIEITSTDVETLPDVTLRELQSAVYELSCQFGKLDRVTDLFEGVTLNTEALYPRDTLYPANDLYPGGSMDKTVKSSYSRLWTDTVGEQSFRYLIITYKGLDQNNQATEKTLQMTVNANGTTDYYMDSNWLFKNLIWTDAKVEEYAAAMVARLRGITWFPFEMWGAGLPYIETGDQIEIVTQEGSFTSYILQRQLSGIQNLQDTFINGELDIF